MDSQDIRWQQRFSNYRKALSKLTEVVELSFHKSLSELEKEGLIQRFEYTYELAWKTLQDLLRAKGYLDIVGPTPTLSQAFKDGLISNGESWKKMKSSRELTSHTYNSETAQDIADQVIHSFYHLLKDLEGVLIKEASSDQTDLWA